MSRKVSSIILSKPDKGTYEVSYIDYRWVRPGYTGTRKHKRFNSIDAANAFLRDLYMRIDGMANVTNYTYKPQNENSIERYSDSGLIHINTVNEYANFMFFSKDSDFNQPSPSTAFIPEHVVGAVFNYIAGAKYMQTKRVLNSATLVGMQKTA
ncbi:MAG: hypothetical protein IJX89_02700 [Alphaproteobacteria bacterium]|nr:hypothetical protein [Alphaproteobacteria bacterium]